MYTTPENLLRARDTPPVHLELICDDCAATLSVTAPYAVYAMDPAAHGLPEWDGLMIMRIVRCHGCGAVDQYHLSPASKLALTLQAVAAKRIKRADPNAGPSASVIEGISQIWDGTISQRPTQAIAHLRMLVERDTENAEGWRRLGNALERFGEIEQAVEPWLRAIEIDPDDAESAHSLMEYHAGRSDWAESAHWQARLVKCLPIRRAISPDMRRSLSDACIDRLQQFLALSDEPLGLMATWVDPFNSEGRRK